MHAWALTLLLTSAWQTTILSLLKTCHTFHPCVATFNVSSGNHLHYSIHKLVPLPTSLSLSAASHVTQKPQLATSKFLCKPLTQLKNKRPVCMCTPFWPIGRDTFNKSVQGLFVLTNKSVTWELACCIQATAVNYYK